MNNRADTDMHMSAHNSDGLKFSYLPVAGRSLGPRPGKIINQKGCGVRPKAARRGDAIGVCRESGRGARRRAYVASCEAELRNSQQRCSLKKTASRQQSKIHASPLNFPPFRPLGAAPSPRHPKNANAPIIIYSAVVYEVSSLMRQLATAQVTTCKLGVMAHHGYRTAHVARSC